METKALQEAWVKQFSHNLELSFHEAYHYWQALRLPFIHRYALLSFRTVMRAFKQLDSIPDLHKWDCILPELSRLTLPSRWHCAGPGQVSVQRLSPPDEKEGVDLTPLDLMEGAASVAQWQTVVARGAERQSWLHFNRWSKRNAAYTTAVKLVAEGVGDHDLALRCFIPMVNAAFHTSEPVLTLGYLTCFITRPEIAGWREHPEPSDWRSFFGKTLDLIPFKGRPDNDAMILGSPYHYITDNWLGTDPPHPMLTKMSRHLRELEETDERYTLLLDQPGYLEGDFVAEAMRDFAPTTIMSLRRADDEGQVIMTGASDVGEADVTSHGYVWLQTLTIYSVIRRASGAQFEPDLRLCHHRNCPEYNANYCNSFPRIPVKFGDCRFRTTVEELRQSMKESRNAK